MKKYACALIALYILIYLLPLGGRPMLTPDEFRYGEIPREMIATGNWVVPKLIGVRYFEKPVMGYWLNAVSLLCFGENAFAVRLASALTTGLAALLLFFLIWKIRRDPEEAFLNCGIFLTFGMVFGVGTFAVLDAPTAFFVNGTLICFYLGCRQEKWSWRKFAALAAAGTFAGCGFLTKGFLAFAVPVLTIVPYLLWTKRWKEILILPWIPLVFALLVSLPWSLAIYRREPGFWEYFFWDEHVKRFLESSGTHHPEPFYFYLPFLLLGALPAALFLPAAAAGFRKRARILLADDFVRFTLCWLVFPFLFFSLCSGKLPTYILPCFMPLAILLSRGLLEYFRSGRHRIFDISAKVLCLLLPLGALGFVTVQLLADSGAFRGMFAPEEKWKWLAACGGTAFWVWALWKASRCSRYRYKLVWFICGPAVLFLLSFFIIPRRYLEGKAQGLFLEEFRDRVKPGMTIVAHPNVMHAAAWIFKNSDILFYTHGGELEIGLKYKDSRNRLITPEQLQDLIKNSPRGKIIYIMRGDFRESVPRAPFERYNHEIMFSNY
ncbi:MAG: phospholipid carrier-dependent glycosyltransferase [Victivallales bacterium]|nr:phospholipid carrier-dependent glycosyltransferase [Victivallales bacterium]